MKKNKTSIDLIDIEIALLILTIVIAIIVKDFTIMFYYWCIVVVVGIVYYVYEYNVRYKKNNKMQLESLRNIRKQLYYFGIAGAIIYPFIYNVLDYKLPFQDFFITLLSSYVAVSIISLVICIIMIVQKKRQLANEVTDE